MENSKTAKQQNREDPYRAFPVLYLLGKVYTAEKRLFYGSAPPGGSAHIGGMAHAAGATRGRQALAYPANWLDLSAVAF